MNDHPLVWLVAIGAVVVVFIWIFRQRPADKFLSMLGYGYKVETLTREWQHLDEQSKAVVKDGLVAKLESEVGGMESIEIKTLLRIHKALQALGLDTLTSDQWQRLIETAWDKDPEATDIEELAAAVWPKNSNPNDMPSPLIPRQLAERLLARPDVKLHLIIGRVYEGLLLQAVPRLVATGDGDRLLLISKTCMDTDFLDNFTQCLGHAANDSAKVSCLIGIDDREAIRGFLDTEADEMQLARLALYLYRCEKELSPA